MRITQSSRHYYASTVLLDGVEITDFIWADEATGEVMSVTYGPRDAQGFRSETRKLLKGKVRITVNAAHVHPSPDRSQRLQRSMKTASCVVAPDQGDAWSKHLALFGAMAERPRASFRFLSEAR